MKEKLRTGIREALLAKTDLSEEDLPAFSVEVPKDESHGDLATNVAMLLARTLKRAPRDIAALIAAELHELPFVAKVDIAGPGFINVFIERDAWHQVLREVLEQGADFGRSLCPGADRVMVEFVSANPTGPLHFGHGRGAVVGDVLAKLLSFSGREVFREFYVNDAGNQVRNLALSLAWWMRRDAGEEDPFPEDGYHGDYVADLARAAPASLKAFLPGHPDEAQIEALRAYGVKAMLEQIQADLEAFGVRMDRFASERALLASGRIEETFAELEGKGLIEERDGARWFLSDRFGDEKARVLVKSDGSNTYFATDVAYHLDKLRRGYTALINVWGADHHGYVPRMKASLQALGQPPEALEVVLVQMVSLVRDGKPVVLRKRAGAITTLRQVFEEVGRDAARFFFLMRGTDSQMEFDLELAKKRSLDNPVYYVQYGHARLSSILARAERDGIAVPQPSDAAEVDLSALTLDEELRLIRKMSTLAEVVRRAADSRSPQQVVYYLQELVGDFHSYYTATGASDPILRGDPDRIRARLMLVLGLRQVVQNTLGLLGVSAPDRMESLDSEEADG